MYLAQPTAQYALYTKSNGQIPVYAWGSPFPITYKDVVAGERVKIGTTIQYTPGTNNQWRYSQSQLDIWNVEFKVEYEGNRFGAKALELMKLMDYYDIYGNLPPLNKMFR